MVYEPLADQTENLLGGGRSQGLFNKVSTISASESACFLMAAATTDAKNNDFNFMISGIMNN
jgi:hypothetical protein